MCVHARARVCVCVCVCLAYNKRRFDGAAITTVHAFGQAFAFQYKHIEYDRRLHVSVCVCKRERVSMCIASMPFGNHLHEHVKRVHVQRGACEHCQRMFVVNA
jgi:hypothetical protein